MFEESLVESAGLLRPRNHRSVAISIGIQTAIAATLLAIPLIHPEILPLHIPAMSLIAPPPRSVPPPAPQPRERVRVENAKAIAVPSTSAAPTPLGPRIPHPESSSLEPEGPPAEGPINITGSGTSGLPSALGSGPIGSGPRVVAAAAGTSARARISMGVSAGLLLAPIRPVYPPIARAAHMEGTVVVQAIISRTGAIESARVVSGPAMLQAAALEAVRSAHYRPYLLSGEPTEVDTTFSINFRLGSS